MSFTIGLVLPNPVWAHGGGGSGGGGGGNGGGGGSSSSAGGGGGNGGGGGSSSSAGGGGHGGSTAQVTAAILMVQPTAGDLATLTSGIRATMLCQREAPIRKTLRVGRDS